PFSSTVARSLIVAPALKTCVFFMKDVCLYRAEFRSWTISTATYHPFIPHLDSLHPQLLLILLFMTLILRATLEQQEIWGESEPILRTTLHCRHFLLAIWCAFTRLRSSTRKSAGFPDLSLLNVRRLLFLLSRANDSRDGA
ncbi:hypothetical protein BDV93DRAFT_529029, partial [Ceratobasidium sp. AG-I]